ncbi:MAG: enoyl-CoA hydratase-related protein, partial [Candidatus Cloacimonadales bacterium]
NLSASEAAKLARFGAKVFAKIEKLPFPVIAMVNGFALGGGCELAMACDLRIASEQAKFGQPEVGLGIIPGFGGTQRLSRLVGLARAKELIFSGELITAQQAEKFGLLNQVVAAEDLWSSTEELALKITKNSTTAIAAAKQAIDLGMQTDLNSGLQMEANLFGICFSTADQKEGMAAFLAKRKARF